MEQRFSERIGITEPPSTIQTEEMNDALKNSLWNFIYTLFETHPDSWRVSARLVARFFRKIPVDEAPIIQYDCKKWFKSYFYSLEWYEVYNLIEFIISDIKSILYPKSTSSTKKRAITTCNHILKIELSGYRFVSETLVPISNPAESDEIAAAIDETRGKGLFGAHQHIETSLKLLGKKPDPDYRNAIKEAISAVESVAKKISGAGGSGLVPALNALAAQISMHGALKEGFIKLYGYSSDEDGIRHAILDEPDVGFDEAKYMIVSCSAFVNYLISKADSCGLLQQ